ncbi:uncharacterized protein MEPE_02954 [Melanopsichium pennsylvanicum]|uniref:Uncharacterized protein n=2 Tax=Melanopsichium pennsylvanicum TaxID=63383 RepID=A0AAJ4XLP3_9BASI|nr:uncharacterized protein BN887_01109 [Melanopsichium pennsylvanicum 4]SNX84246.1 uncharacterized protein MEPE_02954 [Melanopsichium pennsylvanicum]
MQLFTLFAGILCLMSGVSYALPGPVAEMDQVPGGIHLWNTVTNMGQFPGHGHANNFNLGVTAEWKNHLAQFAEQDISRAFPYLQQRFVRFLQRGRDVLPVAEAKDQWLARHLVNAYVNRRRVNMAHALHVGGARQNAEELSVHGPPGSSSSDDEGTASSYW